MSYRVCPQCKASPALLAPVCRPCARRNEDPAAADRRAKRYIENRIALDIRHLLEEK